MVKPNEQILREDSRLINLFSLIFNINTINNKRFRILKINYLN